MLLVGGVIMILLLTIISVPMSVYLKDSVTSMPEAVSKGILACFTIFIAAFAASWCAMV